MQYHKHGLPDGVGDKHQVYKDGQTHPSNINPGLRDLSTHLKTGTCQDEGPSSSPLHPPNTHIHHMMTPSFAPENGDVSWVVTLNTPQEDIGRQVDRVLCFGPVAILTHIIKQKSFNHCTTGPYLINRVPLLPVPEQHLSRTRPYPQRSSGRWLTIRGKLAAKTDMTLGPCESVQFREDVYVLENPRPTPNREYIFMPVSELANVAMAAVCEAGTATEAFGALSSDGVGMMTTPAAIHSEVAALLDERVEKWDDPSKLKSHSSQIWDE